VLSAVLKKGLSSLEAMATVGELLFMRFLSPAIIYPVRAMPELERAFRASAHVLGRSAGRSTENRRQEPYGIVTDTPVSPQARRNLTLVRSRACRLRARAAGPLRALTTPQTRRSSLAVHRHRSPRCSRACRAAPSPSSSASRT